MLRKPAGALLALLLAPLPPTVGPVGALVLGAVAPLPATAQTAPPDRASGLLARALAEGRSGDWAAAAATAAQAGSVAEALVEWHRLRTPEGDWRAVAAFAAAHPDWPQLDLKRSRAEATLADAPPAAVIAHFAGTLPVTGAGALALAAAQRASGAPALADATARHAWRTLDLTPEHEAALLADHAEALAPHHFERLDALLWRGQRAQAERQAARMGPGHVALAAARLGLRERLDGVDALIAAVPAALADDPGLAFERFDWRMSRDLRDSATALILERSEAGTLGRPEAWARWRAFLARQAMWAGEARLAYRLAAGHGLDDGAAFADLEWLAGFIALTDLDDPATALRHFQHLRVRVGSAISLARAGYWEGRAHAALGDAESAHAAFAFGAEHQTAFYGLLAAEAAGLPMDPALAGNGPVPDWRAGVLPGLPALQAAQLLAEAGQWHSARRFVMHLAEILPADEVARLAEWALARDEPNWAVNIAKIAAQREIVMVRPLFPVTWLAELDLPVEPALALAIARRESEFDPAVISHADARGLMQVLPGTGELVARRLGLPFEASQLISDPRLNVTLGAAYLAQLAEEFGAAPILVAAGYNAGPGRPRRWLREMGDPRDPAIDPVDWIERVPIAETRNYIMRVMESLMVYRARLAGGPVPLRLTDELAGR